ncbi:MAG: FAD-dependent oxidoreductase [Candidatus Gastranaerophilales bacterium]|nr:FAD-dependent oxidoreductase [Candidatus Gastranaerophilales bacterium]
MFETDVDVIVVGAGSAGCACAITLARAGKKVALIDRGDFAGAKNMFGGAVHIKAAQEIYPDLLNSAPIERFITRHNYAILGKEDGTFIGYVNPQEPYESFSTSKSKFDRWCVDQAIKEGVYFIPQTVVSSLIKYDGKVAGIKTAKEEFYAPLTVVADGVNSLLAQQIGLQKDIKPKDVALSVKHLLTLPKETIEERFRLSDNTGSAYTIMGGPMLGMAGLAFIYTNQNSISIGIGITLEDLNNIEIRPHELLGKLKEHPLINPLIKDTELKEYSAHMIPEGGYHSVGKLYDDGVMVIGDAAMLVNNLHWEGANLAMMSGKFAALAAVEALDKNDYSGKTLKKYKKLLDESFVMKDLKTYRNFMPLIENNSKTLLKFYPEKLNEFFKFFTSTDGIPKKQKYWTFIRGVIKERGIFGLGSDAVKIAKLIMEILL